MKLLILTLSLAIGTGFCEDIKFTKLRAADKDYLVELEARQALEIDCLKRIDASLVPRWNIEEKKIPLDDLGEKPEADRRSLDAIPSSNHLYNSVLEEWLLDSDISPSQKIETCLLGVTEGILPLVPVRDVKCWEELIESHIAAEVKMEKEFVELLNTLNREQIMFRKFWNFREYVEMMFQNRSREGLSGFENDVYGHMKYFLPTEGDKDRKVFVIRQDCSGERFGALNEAPDSEARFEEFKSQVRHMVNLKLGRAILPMAYTSIHNMTLIIERHAEWLKIREKTMVRLTEEVEKLKSQDKDVKWLCKYATELASDIFGEQSSVLKSRYERDFTSELAETASRINDIEKILKNRNDERQSSIQTLSTNITKDRTCLEGFAKMVINHHDIATISALTDSRHSYQEISCVDHTSGSTVGILNKYCNCIGSFCVVQALDSPRPDDYEIVRGNDGVYKMIPSSRLIWVLEREREFAMRNSSATIKERR